MTRFIVSHTLPWSEEYIIHAAKQFPQLLPSGVSWKRSYCDFDAKKFFCEWEAPDKQTLTNVFKTSNIPFVVENIAFEGIYPVKLLDVAKAQLEP